MYIKQTKEETLKGYAPAGGFMMRKPLSKAAGALPNVAF